MINRKRIYIQIAWSVQILMDDSVYVISVHYDDTYTLAGLRKLFINAGRNVNVPRNRLPL